MNKIIDMKIDAIIESYCRKALDTDAGAALDRLIEIYLNACGISVGERSMAYLASIYWIYRCKEDGQSIPEDAQFRDVMALRSEEYRRRKEEIDKYDIAMLDPKEILRILTMMLDDYKDDLTRTALCMGVLFYLSSLMED